MVDKFRTVDGGSVLRSLRAQWIVQFGLLSDRVGMLSWF